jgi:hypothetical protein
MKKIITFTVCLIAFQLANAQCPCRVFAELTDGDITIPRLTWKTTADFIVKIKNKGSCGWEKDKIYVMVDVTVRPKESREADVEKTFMTSKKFYTADDVTLLGAEAEFRLRFDPPDYPGRYQINVKFYAGGVMIASSQSRAIDWK